MLPDSIVARTTRGNKNFIGLLRLLGLPRLALAMIVKYAYNIFSRSFSHCVCVYVPDNPNNPICMIGGVTRGANSLR